MAKCMSKEDQDPGLSQNICVVGVERSDGCTYSSFEPWIVVQDRDEAQYVVILIDEAFERARELGDNQLVQYRGHTLKIEPRTDDGGHMVEVPFLSASIPCGAGKGNR